MRREKGIEIATYVIVALAIWVFSPWLGKRIDSLYFDYPKMFADSSAMVLLGLCIVVPGTILAAWTILLFKTEGQGTPNPKVPPKEFVASGPYRFSRNPMALGGFLVLVGEAMLYYSPSLVGISMLYGLIIYLNALYVEEPELRQRFGEPYEDYLRRVPRFLPRPWRRRK